MGRHNGRQMRFGRAKYDENSAGVSRIYRDTTPSVHTRPEKPQWVMPPGSESMEAFPSATTFVENSTATVYLVDILSPCPMESAVPVRVSLTDSLSSFLSKIAEEAPQVLEFVDAWNKLTDENDAVDVWMQWCMQMKRQSKQKSGAPTVSIFNYPRAKAKEVWQVLPCFPEPCPEHPSSPHAAYVEMLRRKKKTIDGCGFVPTPLPPRPQPQPLQVQETEEVVVSSSKISQQTLSNCIPEWTVVSRGDAFRVLACVPYVRFIVRAADDAALDPLRAAVDLLSVSHATVDDVLRVLPAGSPRSPHTLHSPLSVFLEHHLRRADPALCPPLADLQRLPGADALCIDLCPSVSPLHIALRHGAMPLVREMLRALPVGVFMSEQLLYRRLTMMAADAALPHAASLALLDAFLDRAASSELGAQSCAHWLTGETLARLMFAAPSSASDALQRAAMLGKVLALVQQQPAVLGEVLLAPDHIGMTVLHYACSAGAAWLDANDAFFRALLSATSDIVERHLVDRTCQSPVSLAVSAGNYAFVDFVLSATKLPWVTVLLGEPMDGVFRRAYGSNDIALCRIRKQVFEPDYLRPLETLVAFWLPKWKQSLTEEPWSWVVQLRSVLRRSDPFAAAQLSKVQSKVQLLIKAAEVLGLDVSDAEAVQSHLWEVDSHGWTELHYLCARRRPSASLAPLVSPLSDADLKKLHYLIGIVPEWLLTSDSVPSPVAIAAANGDFELVDMFLKRHPWEVVLLGISASVSGKLVGAITQSPLAFRPSKIPSKCRIESPANETHNAGYRHFAALDQLVRWWRSSWAAYLETPWKFVERLTAICAGEDPLCRVGILDGFGCLFVDAVVCLQLDVSVSQVLALASTALNAAPVKSQYRLAPSTHEHRGEAVWRSVRCFLCSVVLTRKHIPSIIATQCATFLQELATYIAAPTHLVSPAAAARLFRDVLSIVHRLYHVSSKQESPSSDARTCIKGLLTTWRGFRERTESVVDDAEQLLRMRIVWQSGLDMSLDLLALLVQDTELLPAPVSLGIVRSFLELCGAAPPACALLVRLITATMTDSAFLKLWPSIALLSLRDVLKLSPSLAPYQRAAVSVIEGVDAPLLHAFYGALHKLANTVAQGGAGANESGVFSLQRRQEVTAAALALLLFHTPSGLRCAVLDAFVVVQSVTLTPADAVFLGSLEVATPPFPNKQHAASEIMGLIARSGGVSCTKSLLGCWPQLMVHVARSKTDSSNSDVTDTAEVPLNATQDESLDIQELDKRPHLLWRELGGKHVTAGRRTYSTFSVIRYASSLARRGIEGFVDALEVIVMWIQAKASVQKAKEDGVATLAEMRSNLQCFDYIVWPLFLATRCSVRVAFCQAYCPPRNQDPCWWVKAARRDSSVKALRKAVVHFLEEIGTYVFGGGAEHPTIPECFENNNFQLQLWCLVQRVLPQQPFWLSPETELTDIPAPVRELVERLQVDHQFHTVSDLLHSEKWRSSTRRASRDRSNDRMRDKRYHISIQFNEAAHRDSQRWVAMLAHAIRHPEAGDSLLMRQVPLPILLRVLGYNRLRCHVQRSHETPNNDVQANLGIAAWEVERGTGVTPRRPTRNLRLLMQVCVSVAPQVRASGKLSDSQVSRLIPRIDFTDDGSFDTSVCRILVGFLVQHSLWVSLIAALKQQRVADSIDTCFTPAFCATLLVCCPQTHLKDIAAASPALRTLLLETYFASSLHRANAKCAWVLGDLRSRSAAEQQELFSSLWVRHGAIEANDIAKAMSWTPLQKADLETVAISKKLVYAVLYSQGQSDNWRLLVREILHAVATGAVKDWKENKSAQRRGLQMLGGLMKDQRLFAGQCVRPNIPAGEAIAFVADEIGKCVVFSQACGEDTAQLYAEVLAMAGGRQWDYERAHRELSARGLADALESLVDIDDSIVEGPLLSWCTSFDEAAAIAALLNPRGSTVPESRARVLDKIMPAVLLTPLTLKQRLELPAFGSWRDAPVRPRATTQGSKGYCYVYEIVRQKLVSPQEFADWWLPGVTTPFAVNDVKGSGAKMSFLLVALLQTKGNEAYTRALFPTLLAKFDNNNLVVLIALFMMFASSTVWIAFIEDLKELFDEDTSESYELKIKNWLLAVFDMYFGLTLNSDDQATKSTLDAYLARREKLKEKYTCEESEVGPVISTPVFSWQLSPEEIWSRCVVWGSFLGFSPMQLSQSFTPQQLLPCVPQRDATSQASKSAAVDLSAQHDIDWARNPRLNVVKHMRDPLFDESRWLQMVSDSFASNTDSNSDRRYKQLLDLFNAAVYAKCHSHAKGILRILENCGVIESHDAILRKLADSVVVFGAYKDCCNFVEVCGGRGQEAVAAILEEWTRKEDDDDDDVRSNASGEHAPTPTQRWPLLSCFAASDDNTQRKSEFLAECLKKRSKGSSPIDPAVSLFLPEYARKQAQSDTHPPKRFLDEPPGNNEEEEGAEEKHWEHAVDDGQLKPVGIDARLQRRSRSVTIGEICSAFHAMAPPDIVLWLATGEPARLVMLLPHSADVVQELRALENSHNQTHVRTFAAHYAQLLSPADVAPSPPPASLTDAQLRKYVEGPVISQNVLVPIAAEKLALFIARFDSDTQRRALRRYIFLPAGRAADSDLLSGVDLISMLALTHVTARHGPSRTTDLLKAMLQMEKKLAHRGAVEHPPAMSQENTQILQLALQLRLLSHADMHDTAHTAQAATCRTLLAGALAAVTRRCTEICAHHRRNLHSALLTALADVEDLLSQCTPQAHLVLRWVQSEPTEAMTREIDAALTSASSKKVCTLRHWVCALLKGAADCVDVSEVARREAAANRKRFEAETEQLAAELRFSPGVRVAVVQRLSASTAKLARKITASILIRHGALLQSLFPVPFRADSRQPLRTATWSIEPSRKFAMQGRHDRNAQAAMTPYRGRACEHTLLGRLALLVFFVDDAKDLLLSEEQLYNTIHAMARDLQKADCHALFELEQKKASSPPPRWVCCCGLQDLSLSRDSPPGAIYSSTAFLVASILGTPQVSPLSGKFSELRVWANFRYINDDTPEMPLASALDDGLSHLSIRSMADFVDMLDENGEEKEASLEMTIAEVYAAYVESVDAVDRKMCFLWMCEHHGLRFLAPLSIVLRLDVLRKVRLARLTGNVRNGAFESTFAVQLTDPPQAALSYTSEHPAQLRVTHVGVFWDALFYLNTPMETLLTCIADCENRRSTRKLSSAAKACWDADRFLLDCIASRRRHELVVAAIARVCGLVLDSDEERTKRHTDNARALQQVYWRSLAQMTTAAERRLHLGLLCTNEILNSSLLHCPLPGDDRAQLLKALYDPGSSFDPCAADTLSGLLLKHRMSPQYLLCVANTRLQSLDSILDDKKDHQEEAVAAPPHEHYALRLSRVIFNQNGVISWLDVMRSCPDGIVTGDLLYDYTRAALLKAFEESRSARCRMSIFFFSLLFPQFCPLLFAYNEPPQAHTHPIIPTTMPNLPAHRIHVTPILHLFLSVPASNSPKRSALIDAFRPGVTLAQVVRTIGQLLPRDDQALTSVCLSALKAFPSSFFLPSVPTGGSRVLGTIFASARQLTDMPEAGEADYVDCVFPLDSACSVVSEDDNDAKDLNKSEKLADAEYSNMYLAANRRFLSVELLSLFEISCLDGDVLLRDLRKHRRQLPRVKQLVVETADMVTHPDVAFLLPMIVAHAAADNTSAAEKLSFSSVTQWIIVAQLADSAKKCLKLMRRQKRAKQKEALGDTSAVDDECSTFVRSVSSVLWARASLPFTFRLIGATMRSRTHMPADTATLRKNLRKMMLHEPSPIRLAATLLHDAKTLGEVFEHLCD